MDADGVDDEDRQQQQAPELSIKVYGRTKDGRSVCVTIRGFRPYFFVASTPQSRPVIQRILGGGTQAFRDHVTTQEIDAKDIWGFCNGEKKRFVRLSFSSQWAMRRMSRALEDTKVCKLYESNVEPVLRYLHVRNLEPSGWLETSRWCPNAFNQPTTCDIDVCVRHEDLEVAKDAHLLPPPPLLVASFDIECASLDVGQFPTATKTYRHMATSMTSMLSKSMVSGTTFKTDRSIALTVQEKILEALTRKTDTVLPGGDGIEFVNRMPQNSQLPYVVPKRAYVNPEKLAEDAANKCAPFLMAMYQKKETEAETILKVEEALQSVLPKQQGDPIIMIGTTVHVNGENECSQKHILALGDGNVTGEADLLLKWAETIASLKPDVLTGYNIFGFDWAFIQERCTELNITHQFAARLGRGPAPPCKFVKKELSSSALGENVMEYYDIPGTVPVDMMKMVQRDHRLPSYSLNEVSKHFLNQQKKDVKPSEIVSMFCCESTRDKVEEYCIQDCALCNILAIKLQTVPNTQGMSNVCSVPMQHIVLRGQGVKIFSLVVKRAGARGFVVPLIRKPPQIVPQREDYDEQEEEGYEGALVLAPKKGVYKCPVVVCDYSSLYPSCMMAENLSHDTIVLDPKYDNLPGVEYNEVSYSSQFDSDLPDKVCRFACNQVGILPTILQELVSQRRMTRARIKDVTDPFQKAVLDGLQLAYKVTANSLYGQMGAVTSPLYMKDLAACTTSAGREMLKKAKAFMETQYDADVIYGDSDSIFCVFPSVREMEDKKEALRLAIQTATEAVRKFKDEVKHPHELTYEKTLMPFVLLGKKKYTGILYEQPEDEGYMKSMGIVLRRRDNANILKTVYGGIIKILLESMDVNRAVDFLDESLKQLTEGHTELEELVITKALRSNYKNPGTIAHKCLADRMAARDPGNAPSVGERIPYVYIATDKVNVLQGDRIEHPDFIRDNHPYIKPDSEYYITHQLMKPISQLMALVLDEIDRSKRPHVNKRLPSEWRQELSKLKIMFPRSPEKVQENYDKRREKFTEHYLFDTILTRLRNKKNNQRQIDTFFHRRSG